MDDTQKDGGPVYPHTRVFENGTGRLESGVTLRDYFAIHGDEPHQPGLASAAGVKFVNGSIWSDGQTKIGTFCDWWESLLDVDRMSLIAKTRYAVADAMLAAREAPQPDPIKDELVEALQFYSREEIYDDMRADAIDAMNNREEGCELQSDRGAKARAALSRAKEEKDD